MSPESTCFRTHDNGELSQCKNRAHLDTVLKYSEPDRLDFRRETALTERGSVTRSSFACQNTFGGSCDAHRAALRRLKAGLQTRIVSSRIRKNLKCWCWFGDKFCIESRAMTGGPQVRSEVWLTHGVRSTLPLWLVPRK